MTNKNRKKSGVYKITIGKHFYIGSSQDVYSRKSSHLSKLKLKKHPNKYMQNVYNKYGKENFVFCASKELGISCTAIYNNLKLLTKSSGGFVWKYN